MMEVDSVWWSKLIAELEAANAALRDHIKIIANGSTWTWNVADA